VKISESGIEILEITNFSENCEEKLKATKLREERRIDTLEHF